LKNKQVVLMPEKASEKSGTGKDIGSDSNLMAAISEFFAFSIVIPLILYLIKKEDRFVKFHSVQAMILGVAGWIVFIGFSVLSTMLAFVSGGIGGLLSCLILPLWLVFGIAALFAAWKAYQGERYKLPVLGDFAEKYS